MFLHIMARIIFHINERIQHAKVPKIVRGQPRLEWEGQTLGGAAAAGAEGGGGTRHVAERKIICCEALVATTYHLG